MSAYPLFRIPLSRLRSLPVAAVLLGVLLSGIGCKQPGPSHLAFWENVRSPEGWTGRRYAENNKRIAEEFDAVGEDGKIDFWRFYTNGRLASEEHDRDNDGHVDYVAKYNHKDESLLSFARDTNFDGSLNLWVDFDGHDSWTQTWDRNHDGTLDLLFSFEGPADSLNRLKLDFYEVTDLRKFIPKQRWREIALDNDMNGQFDLWLRYEEGRAVAQGVGQGPDNRPRRWIPVKTQADASRLTKDAEKSYTSITQVAPGSAEALQHQDQIARQRRSATEPRPPTRQPRRVRPVLQSTDMPDVIAESPPTYPDSEPSPRTTPRQDRATEPEQAREEPGFLDRIRRFFRRNGNDADKQPDTPPVSSFSEDETDHPENIVPITDETTAPTAKARARIVTIGEPPPLPPPGGPVQHPSANLEK